MNKCKIFFTRKLKFLAFLSSLIFFLNNCIKVKQIWDLNVMQLFKIIHDPNKSKDKNKICTYL